MTASKHSGQSVVWLKKPLERFHFSEAKHREDAWCAVKKGDGPQRVQFPPE
jgi:hypothetical protein